MVGGATGRFKELVPQGMLENTQVDSVIEGRDDKGAAFVEVQFKRGDQTIVFTSFDNRIVDYLSGPPGTQSKKAQEWFKTVSKALSNVKPSEGESTVNVIQGKRGGANNPLTMLDKVKELGLQVKYTGEMKEPITPEKLQNLTNKELDIIDWNDCLSKISKMPKEQKEQCLKSIPLDKLAKMHEQKNEDGTPHYQQGKSFTKLLTAFGQLELRETDKLAWTEANKGSLADCFRSYNPQLSSYQARAAINEASGQKVVVQQRQRPQPQPQPPPQQEPQPKQIVDPQFDSW